MVSYKTWLLQNRWLMFILVCEFLVLLFVLVVMRPFIDRSLTFWSELINPSDVVSKSDIEKQVLFYEVENSAMLGRIDSLESWMNASSSDEKRISYIRSAAEVGGLDLAAYDIETQAEDGLISKRFFLTMNGNYHGFGQFVTALENSPYSFLLEELSLRATGFGHSQLACRLVISSRFKDMR